MNFLKNHWYRLIIYPAFLCLIILVARVLLENFNNNGPSIRLYTGGYIFVKLILFISLSCILFPIYLITYADINSKAKDENNIRNGVENNYRIYKYYESLNDSLKPFAFSILVVSTLGVLYYFFPNSTLVAIPFIVSCLILFIGLMAVAAPSWGIFRKENPNFFSFLDYLFFYEALIFLIVWWEVRNYDGFFVAGTEEYSLIFLGMLLMIIVPIIGRIRVKKLRRDFFPAKTKLSKSENSFLNLIDFGWFIVIVFGFAILSKEKDWLEKALLFEIVATTTYFYIPFMIMSYLKNYQLTDYTVNAIFSVFYLLISCVGLYAILSNINEIASPKAFFLPINSFFLSMGLIVLAICGFWGLFSKKLRERSLNFTKGLTEKGSPN